MITASLVASWWLMLVYILSQGYIKFLQEREIVFN